MSYQLSLNVTSSQGSESGPTRSGAPDGPTTDQCGPDLVPANLSASQAKKAGLLTSGTYGPHGNTSSESASLQSSLVSRLQVKTASLGSTLYKLTWKDRVTPSGRMICALRASVRRTSGSDCFLSLMGWGTPTAHEPRLGYQNRRNGKKGTQKSMTTEVIDYFDPIRGDPQLAGWPREHATAPQYPVRLTACGQVLIGSAAGMESSGQLNPSMSKWLMGLPDAWDTCAIRAEKKLKEK